MGKYVQIFIFALAGWSASVSGAVAVSLADQNMYHSIATCLGRYSAELEFAYLIGEDAQEPNATRAKFVELYRAMDPGPELLALRITAKQQHAQLLNLSTFSDDPQRARIASGAVAAQVRSCSHLLF